MFAPAGGADDARLRPAAAVRPRGRRRPRARARRDQRHSRAPSTSPRDGVLALSEAIDLLGKRAAAGAAAGRRRPGRRRRCAGWVCGSRPRWSNLLRFGRGVDNRLFKATGFRYGFTSRETVIRLGEHLRLAPILRARAGDDTLSLRARGRGVPALEPARPPRARRRRAASPPTASRWGSEELIAGATSAPEPDRAPAYTSWPLGAQAPDRRRLPDRDHAARGGRRLRVGFHAQRQDRRGGHDRRRGRRRHDRRRGRQAVDKELVAPLRRKVTVTYDGVKYQLSSEKLEVSSNVDGMVDRGARPEPGGRAAHPRLALRHRRRGRPRDLAPDDLLKPRDRRVHRQGRRRGRHRAGQRDDRADIGLARRRRRASRASASTRAALRTRIESVIQRTSHRTRLGPGRRGPARGQQGRPRRAVSDLHHRRPVELHGDALEGPRSRSRSTRSRWASPQYPTPTGLYSIQNKQVDPVWSVPNSDWAGELAGTVVQGGTDANPLKSRWMGVTDGVGFHGTSEVDSLGSAASHGCIRMDVPDVEDLYDQVSGRHARLHRLSSGGQTRLREQATRAPGRRISLRMTDRTALQATPADELEAEPGLAAGARRLRSAS